MSFVYATKDMVGINGEKREYIHIYSDTRVKPEDSTGFMLGRRTLSLVQHFGLIKSMILTPKCCFSFAGNDIRYANTFLEKLYERRSCTDEEMVDLAFAIHQEAGEDLIEFIFCTSDEDEHITITCIKDNQITRGCNTAWLGSFDAFRELQRLHLEQGWDINYKTFQQAVFNCQRTANKADGRSDVGGFIVDVTFDCESHSFIYPEHFESWNEREQIVMPGESIKLYASAEDGGYTAHYRESPKDFVVDIEQVNISVGFTDRYRLQEENSINSLTDHLMLPILVQTDTNRVLP